MERIIGRATHRAKSPLPFTGASFPALAFVTSVALAVTGLGLIRLSKRRSVRPAEQNTNEER
jgi:hypothetical protein